MVAHVAVSIDGSTVGFEPDVARFYALAETWNEDVTLVGADTILVQEDSLTRGPGPNPDGPVLAVVDSRHRVSRWDDLRDAGHWSDVVALRTSPAGVPTREIVTEGERVDLAAALGQLDADCVRVDSGGALIGAMLAGGLLTEISLLVHPVLAEERIVGTALARSRPTWTHSPPSRSMAASPGSATPYPAEEHVRCATSPTR